MYTKHANQVSTTFKSLQQCLFCNAEFEAYNSDILRGYGKFCSRICSGQYHAKIKKDKAPKRIVKCSFCNKDFIKNESRIKNSKSGLFFCTRECKDKAQRIGGIKEIMPAHYGTSESHKSNNYGECLFCNKELHGRRVLKFCSSNCSTLFRQRKTWEQIESGTYVSKSGNIVLRRYLEFNREYKCELCDNEGMWNGKKIVLHVDHIDGNSENNLLNNLRFLCPNCHSQTETYGIKNKGNGRFERRKRYQEGKSY